MFGRFVCWWLNCCFAGFACLIDCELGFGVRYAICFNLVICGWLLICLFRLFCWCLLVVCLFWVVLLFSICCFGVDYLLVLRLFVCEVCLRFGCCLDCVGDLGWFAAWSLFAWMFYVWKWPVCLFELIVWGLLVLCLLYC